MTLPPAMQGRPVRDRPDRKSSTPTRRSFRLAFVSAVLVLCVVIGLFAAFASRIAHEGRPADIAADGIVVLTGGASRVQDAVRLLEDGRAERLLISGVYPETTPQEIAAAIAANERLFECCIDLDYRAQNTFGNATEARDWAKRNGYRSLIVVTNDYHMPRSLVELNRTLPDVTLKPFPVGSDRVRPTDWWNDPTTARVMMGEFVKYSLALVDLRFGRSIDDRYEAAAVPD